MQVKSVRVLSMSIFWGEVYLHFFVDDFLFRAKDEADITQFVLSLRKQGVNIDKEDDDSGFLRFKLECDAETGLIEICQDVIIDRVISQLVLDNRAYNVK